MFVLNAGCYSMMLLNEGDTARTQCQVLIPSMQVGQNSRIANTGG
uniref:Uncharacterized protein n=1 Tax=Picea glauca TaxID=3330 RepID=A0A101LWC6_PICGL|nr:hypothetical protein ABT39_MTgene1656 [Picea glauca]QHR87939.1 hypothetical protein Q903MT_gene1951 [Picea sitchensis]